MPRVPVAALVVGVLLPALAGQPHAQTVTSQQLEGRVVADDTGEPIPNVKVALGTAAATRATLSDRDGRFTLDAPPGTPRLTFAKAGYARREMTMPSGRVAGTIRLARTAIITGRVVESSGEPAVNVSLRAELVGAGGQMSVLSSTTTDDHGDYRLSGLPAGRVVVAVRALGAPVIQPRGGAGFTLSPSNVNVYFPGVASASEAEPLELNAGDEHARIDFVLPASYVAPAMNGGTVSLLAAQPSNPPPPGEVATTVRGRVVNAIGGVIAGARITLMRQARGEAVSAQSDTDGRFAFADIVPGPFLIGAARTGFSGDSFPPGRPLTVTATGADVELTLTPWGDISGRVLDDLDEPVQGAVVQLLRLQFQDGRRRLVPAGAFSRATDDRGVYRLFAVPPGQYIVSASVSDVSTAELPGYARTYYPGVADVASSPFLMLGPGQSQPGANITLVRQRTARLSGTVRDAEGRPGLVGSLSLIPSQSSSALAAPVGARVGDGGVFEFPNVAPGQYVIQAYRGSRSRSVQGEFGVLAVTVGERDVEGLTVQAMTGSAITGRVSFIRAGAADAPPRAGIDIEAVPMDPDLAPQGTRATADIRADWTLTLQGISGPRRLEVTRLPPGWALREIRARGVDVTDRPLAFGTAAQSIDDVDVVLTDRVTSIVGRVRDRDGRPAAGASAILFAPYRDRWYAQSRYMRATTVGRDGSFSVEGLPPGNYYVAAVATLPTGGADAWRDPTFLESLVAPSASLSVGDGGRVEVAVTVVEPR